MDNKKWFVLRVVGHNFEDDVDNLKSGDQFKGHRNSQRNFETESDIADGFYERTNHIENM